eukprot:2898801-Prymnesium_polylepis.3
MGAHRRRRAPPHLSEGRRRARHGGGRGGPGAAEQAVCARARLATSRLAAPPLPGAWHLPTLASRLASSAPPAIPHIHCPTPPPHPWRPPRRLQECAVHAGFELAADAELSFGRSPRDGVSAAWSDELRGVLVVCGGGRYAALEQQQPFGSLVVHAAMGVPPPLPPHGETTAAAAVAEATL